MTLPEVLLIVLAFLLASYLATLLVKWKLKAKTWFLVSMIHSKKPLGLFKKLSKSKLWDAFADLALILAFGALALDFLYYRNFKPAKRITAFLLTLGALFSAYYFTNGFLILKLSLPADQFLLSGVIFSLFGFAYTFSAAILN